MRTILIVLILLLGSALVAAGAAVAFAPDLLRPELPPAPVFQPPIYRAVTGDSVRYERTDAATGEVLGYTDYRVLSAIEYQQTTLGREFDLEIIEKDSRTKKTRTATFRWKPRMHGFLPPFLEDDADFPSGERPVVRSIETVTMRVGKGERTGFLVEAVRPRWSLTEIRDRFWMREDVAVFGVARRESEGVVWTLHTQEMPGR